VSDVGLARLERLSWLEELTIRSSRVTDRGLRLLRRLLRLRFLDLSKTAATDAALDHVKTLRLRHLALGAGITDRAGARLGGLFSLEQLDLAETRLSGQVLRAIRDLPRLHTLFGARRWSDGDMPALARLQTLRRLDLTGARITDRGVAALAPLARLEELSLGQTKVSDRVVETLKGFGALRYLEISDTRLTADGLRRLSEVATLEILSFSWTGEPTRDDLNPLGGLPRLKTLIVNGIPLSREFMERLRAGADRAPGASAPARLLASLQGRLHKALVARWIPDAVAEEAPSGDDADVADARPILVGKRFTGLRRIHEVQSELEEIAPAVSDPVADTFQESERNFLGEFSVGVVGKKK
jgi:hypothetical protein